MSRHIKEPPTVLKILFQRGNYDSTTFVATKKEVKVGIPSEYMFKLQSSNEKISYTLIKSLYHYKYLVKHGKMPGPKRGGQVVKAHPTTTKRSQITVTQQL